MVESQELRVVRSFSYSQQDILLSIQRLHCPDGFDADLTYGNGKFWEGITKPVYRFDISPQTEDTQQACSTNVPVEGNQLKSVVFDPPFLTYIKSGREHKQGSMVMSKRFGGYWTYQELEDHYKGTLKEAYRIIQKGGTFVVKCQDIIHNHKMHCTHANTIQWASDAGFRLADLFVLAAKHRMPSPQKGTQRHARVFHSYFLVFKK